MKITLTPEQIELRKLFRESVLNHFWGHDGKVLMFNVIDDIAKAYGRPSEAFLDDLTSIPSVGKFWFKTPVSAWLAKHFPVVSKAMFDKKPVDECLAIWKTQKYQKANHSTEKRSKDEKKEMAKTNTNDRKLRAIAELRKNMGDRWAASDWGKVK